MARSWRGQLRPMDRQVSDSVRRIRQLSFPCAALRRRVAPAPCGDRAPRAKAEALRSARAALRAHTVDGHAPFAHPGTWSAFVLLGNPR